MSKTSHHYSVADYILYTLSNNSNTYCETRFGDDSYSNVKFGLNDTNDHETFKHLSELQFLELATEILEEKKMNYQITKTRGDAYFWITISILHIA